MTDKEIITKIGEEIGVEHKPVSQLRWMRLNDREYDVAFEGDKVKGIASRNLKAHHFSLLSPLTELEFLDVSWSKTKIKELPDCSDGFLAIKELNLHSIGLTEVPEWIGGLVSLEDLILGHNPITELPQSICNLTNLKGLWCGHTELRMFPQGMDKLVNLEALDLHFTPLRELPPWTDKLARFEHLTQPIWENHPGVRWIRR